MKQLTAKCYMGGQVLPNRGMRANLLVRDGAPDREARVVEPADGRRRRSHHACRALLRELRRRRCRAAVSPGPERGHESVHQLIAMVTVGHDASAAEGGARQDRAAQRGR